MKTLVSEKQTQMTPVISTIAVLLLFTLFIYLSTPYSAQAEEGETTETTEGTSLVAGETDTTPTETATIPAVPAETKVAHPKISYKLNKAKKWTKSGKTAGKAGKGLSFFSAKVARDGLSGAVSYRVYQLKKGGWTKWAKNSKAVGTKKRQAAGLQMKLTGALGMQFDIAYRVHLVDRGWQPWVINGALCGSKGKLPAIDQAQVKLVRKNSKPRIAEGTYFVTLAKNQDKALSVPKSSTNANVQQKMARFNGESLDERYYLRNENGSITLQSVLSGKFLCDINGKVVQRLWADNDRFRWTATWKSGWALVNASSGMSLSIASGNAVTAQTPTRLELSSTDLFAPGSYAFTNTAKGNVLTVEDGSFSNGAALIVHEEEKSRIEAFSLERAGSNVYRIKNAVSNKALAVKKNSKADGASVCQYAAKKSAKAQKWKAFFKREGGITFRNMATGKLLTASEGGIEERAVVSSADKGAKTQIWTLKQVDYSLTGDAELDAQIAKILESHKTLRSCFSYVVGFKYRSGNKYGRTTLSDATTSKMAKEMIAHHSGNCYRFAALFSWLARGLGYQTVVKAGHVPAAAGGLAPHGWVEVYTGGGKYVCDPDLAHEMPGHSWYMTTYGSAPISYYR